MGGTDIILPGGAGAEGRKAQRAPYVIRTTIPYGVNVNGATSQLSVSIDDCGGQLWGLTHIRAHNGTYEGVLELLTIIRASIG
jgi:hypothetical protein